MRVFLVCGILAFALCWLITYAVATTGECYRPRIALFPVNNLTGWHGDVKCYKGAVVDYR